MKPRTAPVPRFPAALVVLPFAVITLPCLGADNVMPERLVPVPFTAVKITDAFWAPRIEVNRTKVVPHNFKMCETTGRIDNFAKAGGLMPGDFRGIYYDDSDLYKAIEGACYSLATHPDPELDRYLDGVIAKIAAAQRPDGYLFTFYTLKGLDKRYTNFKDMHELYCAGHLIEAAVAHKLATGKDTLLNVAIKLADHIDSVIGPEPDKMPQICGHEEIELALVKLYHLTKQQRYLKLAKFMIDVRGTDAGGRRKKWGEYYQDHAPLARQDRPVGHAVRAMYFYTGAADVAAATGDPSYLAPLARLWSATVERRMYITGGVGSRHDGEAFGDDYELPNDTAYCETCASIGNAFWNHRMNLLHADAKYFDVVERVLYNGMLSGVSFSGDRFFYVNPLASRGKHHRSEWFGTACCPSNVVRVLPSIPGYMYATRGDELFVNLYAASRAEVPGGGGLVLTQRANYPWDGKVTIVPELTAARDLKLRLRIPGWARSHAIRVNGQAVEGVKVEAGYARLDRRFAPGDAIELDLPMPVERVYAHPQVKANAGRVALQRGPIVYCVEAVDNGGRTFNLSLPKDSELKAEHRPDLLNGVTVITGKALAHARTAERPGEVSATEVTLTAIPYYAWDHRQPGEMQVWLAEDPAVATPAPPPTVATTARASASHTWRHDTVEAVNDLIEPRSSNDQSIPRFTWWDRKGSEQWLQLDLASRRTVRKAEVYWFDDAPTGGCRVPASWKLVYHAGDGQWKPVEPAGPYGVKKDAYNAVTFAPVEAAAVRLVVQLQPGFSAGVLEWKLE